MTSRATIAVQVLIASLIALSVLSLRWHMVHAHGLQFPIHDQWYAEFRGMYKPFLEGTLTLGHFFSAHNEHVVALNKAVHLVLLIVLGEWNPMAQMYLNAALFAGTLGLAALIVGLRMDALPACVMQALLLGCGMMPHSAENFLLGFQTVWYVYYILSGLCLWTLSRSSRADGWWFCGVALASLSCLCLAAGAANLILCMLAPVWREWQQRQPLRAIAAQALLAASVCAPLIALVLGVAFSHSAELPPTEDPSGSRAVAILAYPGEVVPLTYLPALFAITGWLTRGGASWMGNLGFRSQFAVWSLAQAGMLLVGRGDFSGRHVELLMFGVLANALLVLGSRPRGGTRALGAERWWGIARAVWIALMLGGLAFRAVSSRKAPADFAEEFAARYDFLAESRIEGNYESMLSGSFETGLPATVFGREPQLMDDPLLQRILPGFFPIGLSLEPVPDLGLVQSSRTLFPTAFPFLPWAKMTPEADAPRVRVFSATGFQTAYAKIVVGGRWSLPGTGLYSWPDSDSRLGLKLPFSQGPGWRAVFLPVVDGGIRFEARLEGHRDWLFLQQPIPCSRLQVVMEFAGRQANRVWAVSLGGCVALMVGTALLSTRGGGGRDGTGDSGS